MTTKKPLFNRPAWATSARSTTAPVSEEPVFGRHGQRVYDGILEIERKEREEKERKAKEEAASKDPLPHQSKRRRISKEDNDISHNSDSKVKIKSRRRSTTPESINHKPATRSTPRKEKLSSGLDTLPTKKNSPRSPSKATVITLGDSDGEDDISRIKAAHSTSPSNGKLKASPTKPKKRAVNMSDSDDEDDPYLQELKVKAREKQRLARLGMQADTYKASPTPAIDLKSPTPDPSHSTDHDPSIITPPKPRPSSPPPDDPEVQILIKPLIPNTKALIVGRRSSQNLEPVKSFWCKKQGLSDAEAAKVFFIWRDIKLFNSSTMRHIVDRLSKERRPGQDDSDGKIIIEAVTQEIFDYQQAEKARRAAAQAAAENGEFLEEDVLSPPPEPEKGNKFIIKLQSKEYGELPIRIRPESTVSKIAGGFMQQKAPNTTKTPYLLFDGDRLEGEQTAQEVGLEDGDVVEVQFR